MPDEIIFPAGTLVKVDGIPFGLKSETVLIGHKNNLSLIDQPGVLVPPGSPVAPTVMLDPVFDQDLESTTHD